MTDIKRPKGNRVSPTWYSRNELWGGIALAAIAGFIAGAAFF